jgi:hypothetical protein
VVPKGDKKSKKLKAKQLAQETAQKKATVATPRGDGSASPGGRPAVANGDGSVVFSKFDFSTAERVGSKKKKGPQTPMQLLAKVRRSPAFLVSTTSMAPLLLSPHA